MKYLAIRASVKDTGGHGLSCNSISRVQGVDRNTGVRTPKIFV